MAGVLDTAVLGGASLRVGEYAAFLAAEYFADYVPAGGAAVKVAVAGSQETAARMIRALGAAADATGARFTAVDSAEVRVDHVERLFLAVSAELDWDVLAATLVRGAYDRAGIPAAADLRVAAVAAAHDMDPGELYRSVRRALEAQLLRDPMLIRELGRAVYRLAQAQLGGTDVDTAEHRAVLGWLRGEKVPAGLLRPSLITGRVARHNGRALLAGLAALLLATGTPGLVLCIDYARLAEARRPPVEARTGVYYSKAAVLDAYEVLRQLIDATQDLRGLLVLAVLPPELITDENRGLPAYTALALRVADEVRDRRQPNPYSALVRLEVRLEAVA